jgi:hypothetical protein
MPERQYLQSSRRVDESVIEIVLDATEVQATHAMERDVLVARADVRLECDQRGARSSSVRKSHPTVPTQLVRKQR